MIFYLFISRIHVWQIGAPPKKYQNLKIYQKFIFFQHMMSRWFMNHTLKLQCHYFIRDNKKNYFTSEICYRKKKKYSELLFSHNNIIWLAIVKGTKTFIHSFTCYLIFHEAKWRLFRDNFVYDRYTVVVDAREV